MRGTIPIAVALALAAFAARAETPADFAAAFAAEARRADPGLAEPSAPRGRDFFGRAHGREWSCATCHGDVPTTAGEHVVTGKRIAPLAPSANPERFTDAAKVEKWFRRNCNDVLGRPCTAHEKGDVLAWLMTFSGKEAR